MDIIGTNMEEKQRKSKKAMAIITALIIFLLIVSIALFVSIYYLKEAQFKFNIDGKAISTKTMQTDLFLYEGDNVYISLPDIAELIGYKYYNGGYKQYTEDKNQCYLEGSNEVVTFENNETKIYKTPIDDLDYTYFTIDEPIKKSTNGKLYISSKGLNLACNLQFNYSKEENEITIYTLPYLTNYYVSKYKDVAIAQNFNNQKALLYGLLVVQNVDNTDKTSSNTNIRYGIHNLQDKEIVGMKYTDIEFNEGSEEFIVKTEENKVGIITSEGDTKVSPQYDALKQIDKDLNLYMATSNNKKGVIEKNGKILIYLEYDEIGIDNTQFPTNDIKNKYILFNNVIPVKQNGLWGMFNIKGEKILPVEYYTLGCISGSGNSNKNANNILVIPDVKGIVVSKQYDIENSKRQYYGVVNYKGQTMIPPGLESIYSIISNGQEQYTIMISGKPYDLMQYLEQWINPDLWRYNESEYKDKDNTTVDIDMDMNKTNTTNETTTNTIDTTMVNTEEVNSNIQSNEINTNIVLN